MLQGMKCWVKYHPRTGGKLTRNTSKGRFEIKIITWARHARASLRSVMGTHDAFNACKRNPFKWSSSSCPQRKLTLMIQKILDIVSSQCTRRCHLGSARTRFHDMTRDLQRNNAFNFPFRIWFSRWYFVVSLAFWIGVHVLSYPARPNLIPCLYC